MKTAFYYILFFSMLILGGCSDKDTGIVKAEPNVYAKLAGTWRAENSRWIFEFSEEGELEKIRHFVGMDINISEGVLVEELKVGGEATYILGPHSINYDEEKQELEITIIIYFKMEWSNGKMEGRFEDVLVGPIDFDKSKWYPVWKSKSVLFGDGQDSSDVVSVNENQETFSKQ